MQIRASIGTHIVLDEKQLPEGILRALFAYLTIDNPDKPRAVREMVYGAKQMPDTISLWDYNTDGLLEIPRGYVFDFEELLRQNDIEIEWWSDLVYSDKYIIDDAALTSLRDYQEDAKEKLILYCNGILHSPTGSGKTITMLEIIRECRQKTIVFVEKTDILKQWEQAAIGIEDLTVVTRQSIWSKYDELDQDWFDQFGMVIVDECHHISNKSFWNIIQRFPAYYRFGCSATPDSDLEIFPIVKAVIGPVVHQVTEKMAQEFLVIPEIRVVETDFDYDYHPTYREGKKIIRNNYGPMLKAVEKDGNRNWLIMELAIDEANKGNHCIILSKRISHLEEIFNYFPEECMWVWDNENNKCKPLILWNKLYGTNSSEYSVVKDKIENSNIGSILFSTLAQEGTDIPRLNRLFLAYPGRKIRGYEQAIGRIMRTHSGKEDAIVYDFRDSKVPLLNSQFRERAQLIYAKKKYKVVS